jgi:hypothetical protein
VPELPPTLIRFVAELRQGGFSVAVDQTDEAHFGDRLLELADGHNRIRLISDRGQWGIDVVVGASWRSPYMIVLALANSRYVRRALSNEERVRYAVEAMSRLPSTPAELASLNGRIEALNQEAWTDRFGAATKPAE